MSVGWLKAAVTNATAPKVSIISRIKQSLGGFYPPRSKAKVHASDVTKPGFCPRKWALEDLYKIKYKEEYLDTALAATFDVGNAIGDMMAEKWLGKYAIGNWRCSTCGEYRTFCSKPPQGCVKLQECRWDYEEVNFVSKTYGVSGSIDVFVDLGTHKNVVTELKIIRPEDFADIQEPLAEHTLRTQLYLKNIEDSDSAFNHKINLEEARVLYVSRGYGKKNVEFNEILPFREFIVKRDDKRVVPYLKAAQQIKIFRADNSQIPSGICKSETDKHAKNCSVCKFCFSGDHPAVQEKLEI